MFQNSRTQLLGHTLSFPSPVGFHIKLVQHFVLGGEPGTFDKKWLASQFAPTYVVKRETANPMGVPRMN
jgi:hypothetical protein